MSRLTAFLFCLCAAAPVAAQEIVVIGDSIMDWNEGSESIPAQLSAQLGLPVDDRAVSGAQVNPGIIGRALGSDIPAQLDGATPDILVLTGGGNDFGDGCGCRACDAELESLMTANGGGDLGLFLQEQVSQGVQVIYLGYYHPPVGGNAFSACIPWMLEMDQRIITLAAKTDGLTFVSAASVIDPNDRSLYDQDYVHPSPKAAEIIGALLANVIRALPDS